MMMVTTMRMKSSSSSSSSSSLVVVYGRLAGLVLVAALICLSYGSGSASAAFLYGDGIFDYGTSYGFYRLDLSQENLDPEVVYQIDYVDNAHGGCVDSKNLLVSR